LKQNKGLAGYGGRYEQVLCETENELGIQGGPAAPDIPRHFSNRARTTCHSSGGSATAPACGSVELDDGDTGWRFSQHGEGTITTIKNAPTCFEKLCKSFAFRNDSHLE
jgi:hypothetical protein